MFVPLTLQTALLILVYYQTLKPGNLIHAVGFFHSLLNRVHPLFHSRRPGRFSPRGSTTLSSSRVLVHKLPVFPSPAMSNCKYVYLLYLCSDAVINPFWVGVITNALHAIGVRWNMMTSYKSKFNKLFYTLSLIHI